MGALPFYLLPAQMEKPALNPAPPQPAELMIGSLKRTYIRLLVPAIFGFIIAFLIKTYTSFNPDPAGALKRLSPFVFVLSVALGIAFPLFWRALFAHKIRLQTAVSEAALLSFERVFLYLALTTPYLTLVAYLFDFPRFHLAGIFLTALYAAYFYYPSQRRIAFERKTFRVR